MEPGFASAVAAHSVIYPLLLPVGHASIVTKLFYLALGLTWLLLASCSTCMLGRRQRRKRVKIVNGY